MMRLFRATAVLLVLLVPATAVAEKKEKKREIILETEAHDQKAGEEVVEEVAAQMGIVDDPELAAYVQAIGQRLVRYAPRRNFQYRFQIVDQDVPNAFALPGGFIFVSRGLIALANSEDELANVISHEIVHVAARHASARQQVINDLPGPFAFLAMGHILGYSRDQEREADRLGQGLAAVAGYDPNGMADFMRDLGFTERLELGGARLPGFYDTHPVTSERAATASSRAQMTRWTPGPHVAPGPDGYLHMIDGMIVGLSGAEGAFIGDRFLHPGLGFAMRFPPGWETMNSHVAVGAQAPNRAGQVFLEFHGEGKDPVQAAVEFIAKTQEDGIPFDVDRSEGIKISGYDAYRVYGRIGTRGGRARVLLTFIAFDEVVFRLTGATRDGSDRYDGTFKNVARSFRAITPQEREQVHETRLRIVEAASGESLLALAQRTGNVWNMQQTAVMNDLRADDVLDEGRLVKIAVEEAYQPAPEAR